MGNIFIKCVKIDRKKRKYKREGYVIEKREILYNNE